MKKARHLPGEDLKKSEQQVPRGLKPARNDTIKSFVQRG
jgi:hypothetical protein